MSTAEACGGFTSKHAIDVAVQEGLARCARHAQQIDITVTVEVGGVIVGAGGGRVDHRYVAKRRQGIGLIDNGERAVGIADGKLPCSTGGASLIQNVVTPVVVEVADDHFGQVAGRQYRRVHVGATAEADGHQGAVTLQLRSQRRGFDRADTALQRPVAAQGRCPGVVYGSGDVGTGDSRQFIKEGLALFGFDDIAAIQHQVAVGLECRADAFQCLAVFGKVIAGQPDIAHLHAAVGPVGQQVNGVQALAALKVVGHLLQAVLVRVENHYLGVARQAFEQFADIGYLAIDEYDFLALPALLAAAGGTGWRRRGLV
ncbi:hypothetical protein PS3A_16400 [Pseudomonas sp. 3A(2025)]